jgi:hypothetical protein
MARKRRLLFDAEEGGGTELAKATLEGLGDTREATVCRTAGKEETSKLQMPER